MRGELSIRNKNEEQKRYSVIHWQTGEPREYGDFIVTLKGGIVCKDTFLALADEDGCIRKDWMNNFKDGVVAWCKISDIMPYKEETK